MKFIDGIHAFDTVIICLPQMNNGINIQAEIKFKKNVYTGASNPFT